MERATKLVCCDVREQLLLKLYGIEHIRGGGKGGGGRWGSSGRKSSCQLPKLWWGQFV